MLGLLEIVEKKPDLISRLTGSYRNAAAAEIRDAIQPDFDVKRLDRGKKGELIREWAKAIQMSPGHLTEWINGTHEPDLKWSIMIEILRLKGVDVQAYVMGILAKGGGLSPGLQEFLEDERSVDSVSPEERNALIALDKCGVFRGKSEKDVKLFWAGVLRPARDK